MANKNPFKSINDAYKEYYSDFSHICLSKEEAKKLNTKLILIALCFLGLIIAGGLVRFHGMIYNGFVLIGYMLEVVDLLSLFNALFVFSNRKFKMTDRELKKSIVKMPKCLNTLYFLTGYSFIASIVYVIVCGFHNDVLPFITYLLIKITMFVLSMLFNNLIKDVYFEKDEKNE